MNTRLQSLAQSLVDGTREIIFVRPEDGLLIVRPNRTHHLNPSAAEMLAALYNQPVVDTAAVVRQVAKRYQVPEAQIEGDLERLLDSLALVLQNKPGQAPSVRITPFGSHSRSLPVLSEIALTYRCQNRCFFCYASAPERGRQAKEMDTAQVKSILDKIARQARVPTVSFTGGEPTIRSDLPELIAYAHQLGLRTNLITNGIRCSRSDYVASLAEAGLNSAQVSLEAGEAAIHDAVVGRNGAFQRTVQGLRNLKAASIHTHTNTTINARNLDALPGLIDFLAEMNQPYLSMNMVIRTGDAVGSVDIDYQHIGEIVLGLKERAESHGMRFVWYSPVPFCLFNPAANGLGAQSCSAADGLLSVAPDGQVLPCSSFEQGIGNLLQEDFHTVWNRRSARYWRNKEFVPPGCKDCEMVSLCCGACPLYWDEQGTLAEIAPHMRPATGWEHALWKAKRRWIGQVRGVGVYP